jgi:hypothetical protein
MKTERFTDAQKEIAGVITHVAKDVQWRSTVVTGILALSKLIVGSGTPSNIVVQIADTLNSKAMVPAATIAVVSNAIRFASQKIKESN